MAEQQSAQEPLYDLLVIGGGSGGVRAARMAAGAGRKVALVERDRFGGTCVIRGCVPKKLLSYAGHMGEDLKDAQGYGWQLNAAPSFDWSRLIAAKDQEIDRLESIYRDKLLKGNGVDVIAGHARFIDKSSISVTCAQGNQRLLKAKTILVATGSKAYIPDIKGAERAICSSQAFELERLPASIAIYGGGYIAVEFAGIFSALGVKTHLIYRGDHILRGFDDDLRIHLEQEIQKKGIVLHLNSEITAIEADRVLLNSQSSALEVDCCMIATGRVPNTQDLGLEQAGVETDAKGAIVVDQRFETSQSNIYALGDVINFEQLTPVAITQAMVFLDRFLHGKVRLMDYDNIPSAVFSDPCAACVGLTQQQAEAQGYQLDIYRSKFRAMRHILPNRDEEMFMKLIVDKKSQRVLGLHVIGHEAAEIVQGFAVAIKAGALKSDFDATVGIHPSAAEELVTMRVASDY